MGQRVFTQAADDVCFTVEFRGYGSTRFSRTYPSPPSLLYVSTPNLLDNAERAISLLHRLHHLSKELCFTTVDIDTYPGYLSVWTSLNPLIALAMSDGAEKKWIRAENIDRERFDERFSWKYVKSLALQQFIRGSVIGGCIHICYSPWISMYNAERVRIFISSFGRLGLRKVKILLNDDGHGGESRELERILEVDGQFECYPSPLSIVRFADPSIAEGLEADGPRSRDLWSGALASHSHTGKRAGRQHTHRGRLFRSNGHQPEQIPLPAATFHRAEGVTGGDGSDSDRPKEPFTSGASPAGGSETTIIP